MTVDLKARRKALGLSRDELSKAAYVDKRIIQLLEVTDHTDAEARSRLRRAMDALENDEPLPDFKAELEALKRETTQYFEN